MTYTQRVVKQQLKAKGTGKYAERLGRKEKTLLLTPPTDTMDTKKKRTVTFRTMILKTNTIGTAP